MYQLPLGADLLPDPRPAQRHVRLLPHPIEAFLDLTCLVYLTLRLEALVRPEQRPAVLGKMRQVFTVCSLRLRRAEMPNRLL
jgi:hypothetical protein